MNTRILPIALVLALAPRNGAAQTVTGTVQESTTTPIAAALVWLERPDQEVVARTLSDARGHFRFDAPGPGRFRVVSQHIGHATAPSGFFDLGPGQNRTVVLEAGLSPIRIHGVRTDSDRNCRTLDDSDATVVASFWDEARKALEAARWTEEEGGLTYEVDHFRRELAPEDLRVVDEATTARVGEGANPFKSLPAQLLADSGYVRGDEKSGRDYYAPDAAVLLSTTFLNMHCLRMGESAEDDIVIEFEPVAKGEVPDIRGTLRLDAATLKLQRLKFAYTELELGIDEDDWGGYVDFEELVTGAWIVRHWAIRMPRIQAYRLRSLRIHRDLIGIREVGGVVRSVRDKDGRDLRRADPSDPAH